MNSFDYFSLKVLGIALLVGAISGLLDGCAASPSLAEQETLAASKFANYPENRVAALQEIVATPDLTVDEAYCIAMLKRGQVEPQCTSVFQSLQECGPGRSRCRPTIVIGGGDDDSSDEALAPGVAWHEPVTVTDQLGNSLDERPLQVKKNAYGPGVHQDQYGRAVRTTDQFGFDPLQ